MRTASGEGVLNNSNRVHCFWVVQKVGVGGGSNGDAVELPVVPDSWAAGVAAKLQDWTGGMPERQQVFLHPPPGVAGAGCIAAASRPTTLNAMPINTTTKVAATTRFKR